MVSEGLEPLDIIVVHAEPSIVQVNRVNLHAVAEDESGWCGPAWVPRLVRRGVMSSGRVQKVEVRRTQRSGGEQ